MMMRKNTSAFLSSTAAIALLAAPHAGALSPDNPFGNALIPDLAADPSVVEIDGTFYLYATTDGMGEGLATSGPPVVWKSEDFLNWRFEGTIFPDNFDLKYWAPSAPVEHEGRYYLYPTLEHMITAVVADSPEGPFLAVDGSELHSGADWEPFPMPQDSSIDAEVFIDHDEQAYMVYSRRRMVKLEPNLTEPDGSVIHLETPRGGYSEGPFLFEREGIYYYLYTLGGHEEYQYAYMYSHESPLGPWETPEEDIIARTDRDAGILGPGHGCFFSPEDSDRWYFVYLEYSRASTNRQIFADEMHFNDDGTIVPIELTKEGVGAIRPAGETSPDLAREGTATASSVRPDYDVPAIVHASVDRVEVFHAGQAIDGSNGTRWMAEEDDSEPWWKLDLGEPREITRTEAYFVTPTKGHAYRLEWSLDGDEWHPYGGNAEVVRRSPHNDTEDVRAQYLKLTILEGAPGLWQFRVY